MIIPQQLLVLQNQAVMVKLYNGSTLLGSATAGINGAFAITSSALNDGAYSLTATATDAAGNISPSSALSITILDVTNTENDGSITLAKDSNGYGYAAIKGTDEFIAITDQRGNPIGDKTYSGWSLIGADKVNEVNTTVWKHNNGNYWIHKHNSNWAVTKGGYPETKNSSSFHNLETAFSQDLDNDGFTGSPPVNGGQAKFTISGTKKAGQTLSINQSSTDPDGLNGSYSYQWQRSGDGKTWNNISNTTNTYTILGSDEGNQIRAQITYTDNKGFREEVTTTSLTIPIPVTVTNTENDGSITLAKDSNGYGYAAIKGTDEFIAITDQRGNPIGDKTYSGWSLIGADKVNEVNTTVWKHNNGNYWIHKHNSNWAVTKGGYPETKFI